MRPRIYPKYYINRNDGIRVQVDKPHFFDELKKSFPNPEEVLNKLDEIFRHSTTEIRNRASAISIYLFVEEMIAKDRLQDNEKYLRKFYLSFLDSLQKEVKLGVDFKNRFLVLYQSKVIQAADSKNSIKEKHDKLKKAFRYFLKEDKIIGYN